MIFITGDAASDHLSSLLREHQLPYLEKPFRMAQLLRGVRDVLDRASPPDA